LENLHQASNIKYYFYYLATSIVIIAALKVASEIAVILLLAIFLASIISAFLNFLSKKHIPKVISYFLLGIGVFLVIYLLVAIVNNSLLNFLQTLPTYEQKIKALTLIAIEQLQSHSIIINQEEILSSINFNYVLQFTTNMLSNVGSIFSKMLLITIGVAFILSEAKVFNKKLKIVFKNDTQKLIGFHSFSHNMQRYISVKTMTSLLTGAMIYIALLFFDISYPLLWAFLAFLFNFIPVVGSIVASVPAILLSLLTGDYEATFWLMLVYVAVNISISNILEPKFMGKELNLSPMVIFFSLVFWGWVFGLVGMFLAVPITMTIKIACESSNRTRWLGLFLSHVSSKKQGHQNPNNTTQFS
jgi:predicted PurR-regulated permease PerM